LILAAWMAGRCVSTRVTVRDAFPLDPREELPGPFPAGVERGWRALSAGDPSRAATEFATVIVDERSRAAEIGLIEAEILSGRTADAVAACADAFEQADATLPLLVACGEAAAADGRPRDGYALYRHALARTADRPGLQSRAEALRHAAADGRLADARAAAEDGQSETARQAVAEAVALMPESAALRSAAAEIELAAGDKPRALERYREALELEPGDLSAAEKAGELALEMGELSLAVMLFDGLAKNDPAFKARADEARLVFRAANWPEPERDAARSKRLTRAGAATLVWWMVPEVREALVTSGVIASDVVSRRDSRAVTRALSLGLLESDRETHRANPDGNLTTAAASRLLVRLLAILEPRVERIPCWSGAARPPRTGAEAAQVARRCGLIEGKDAAGVAGPEFVRALDRVRALASSAPGRG
jgi:tetratricopeptide (TPR) repeat protein